VRSSVLRPEILASFHLWQQSNLQYQLSSNGVRSDPGAEGMPVYGCFQYSVHASVEV